MGFLGGGKGGRGRSATVNLCVGATLGTGGGVGSGGGGGGGSVVLSCADGMLVLNFGLRFTRSLTIFLTRMRLGIATQL